MKKYVIGLDYGSDSCRALLVNAITGEELATSIYLYARWNRGEFCNPALNQYRQHPLDYIEGLEFTVRDVLSKLPENERSHIAAISFDTTASTPIVVDENGTPLSLLPEFAENPNAMFVLWKDHTAIQEADEINELAKKWTCDYTAFSGGVYSSEWVWAKMMHVIRVDDKVCSAAYSWVEHSDWMPALLTGNVKPESLSRSRCTAGHKAMWNMAWGGLPPFEFWRSLEPKLACFEEHLFTETVTNDANVGTITDEWAERLGLTTDVIVTVGAIDAHIGAIGAEISPYAFVRVMGTSTCDMMVVRAEEIGDKKIEGICGQVDGSILPGMVGLEAGQSAFGDVYAWFKRLLMWSSDAILYESELIDIDQKKALIKELDDKILVKLSIDAAKIPCSEHNLLALDWFHGRRTPFADQRLTAAITGLTLGTSAPLLFRALVESTAFGSRAIVDSFKNQGVRIDHIIAIGGIAIKAPFVMQTLSNVLGMPIKIAKTDQACALGAAMCAAVAAGFYDTIESAQKAMGQGFDKEYFPDMDCYKFYSEKYKAYNRLGGFVENIIK